MIESIIGILLLISFVWMVVFALKGGNLTMGILIMAIIWTVLPLIGNLVIKDSGFINANKEVFDLGIVDMIKKVFQDGPEGWGPVLVNFLFGAWFGRIMIDTNIASTIIRKTVELGGDKPLVTSTLLYIVSAAIFTSMFGTGGVVAIGVIVLPILMTLGINKKTAVVSYMLSIGAGLYINPVIFNQYQAFFLDTEGKSTYFYDSTYLKWGFIALGLQLAVAILFTAIGQMRSKKQHAWSASAGPSDNTAAPGLALVTPFIPVVLAIVFKIPVIFGFLVASFYALLVCGRLKGGIEGAGKIVAKTFYDGAVDTAPLVAFVLIIPMFNKASELAVPYFNAVLGGIIPNSTLAIAIAFAILAPLGLFRGPFTLAGSGAATLGILKGIGFSTPFLFPLFYAPTVTMNISSCITQSWIVWGLNYTKVDTKEYLKGSIPCGWLITAALSILTLIMFG